MKKRLRVRPNRMARRARRHGMVPCYVIDCKQCVVKKSFERKEE